MSVELRALEFSKSLDSLLCDLAFGCSLASRSVTLARLTSLFDSVFEGTLGAKGQSLAWQDEARNAETYGVATIWARNVCTWDLDADGREEFPRL